MADREILVDLLSSPDLSRRDKILLVLATNPELPLSVSSIEQIAVEAGLREIEKWNISDLLVKARGLAVRVANGWKLTGKGLGYVRTDVLKQDMTSTKPAAINLRSHLAKIGNPDTRGFVEEAVKCLECDLYRAAVVMSWIGAMSVLYDYVIANKLAEFNAEAKRRDVKWKTAVTRDDLALMKESEFLDILTAISVLGKNVKEHLKNTCLNLRNSCGHPSSLKLGKHTVESHIESLVMNVYEKF